MSVETTHLDYAASLAAWTKVRHFLAGGSAVQRYVRQLPGHEASTYTAYKQGAYYLPAVARSVDAFVGMILTPPPVFADAPDAFGAYLEDVSYDGEPASRMIARTVREVCGVGRCAVLVDYPEAGGGLTVAEAERRGLRPYARFYTAEDVLDWRITSEGGERYVSMLKLRERYDAPGPDEWTRRAAEQIRVLDFEDDRYRVRVFRRGGDGKGAFEMTSVAYPMREGRPMEVLPAVVFGADSLDASVVDRPPVLEMVEIAEAHLNNSALLEWALLWVGNPTPVFIGLHLAESESVALGSSQGIALSEGGDAKILHLPADGVGAIRQAMEDKRRDMAAVGARLLADETHAQIARDTAVIQRAGEHSVLALIAQTVADGWTQVLRHLGLWAGLGEEMSVTLNTDFLPQGMSPGELGELLGAVQSAQMSSRDLFGLLQKRGLVRPDKTYDEHRDEIDEDGAGLLQAPTPSADSGAAAA